MLGCSPASQTDHPMGLYCVNGGASHEYEDAAAPTPPSTSSACVDRQVINGYELCKVEFPGGCAEHEEPQAAAAEYCQSTFGDDWLPIGDHGGSCNNGYCVQKAHKTPLARPRASSRIRVASSRIRVASLTMPGSLKTLMCT